MCRMLVLCVLSAPSLIGMSFDCTRWTGSLNGFPITSAIDKVEHALPVEDSNIRYYHTVRAITDGTTNCWCGSVGVVGRCESIAFQVYHDGRVELHSQDGRVELHSQNDLRPRSASDSHELRPLTIHEVIKACRCIGVDLDAIEYVGREYSSVNVSCRGDDRLFKIVESKWKTLLSLEDQAASIDGFIWHYRISDGRAVITAAERLGSETVGEAVTVPFSLHGYPVKEVLGTVFKPGDSVRKLVLSEGVSEVGQFAFRGIALETVSIPASVVNVDRTAFAGGQYREFVVSPDNVKYRAVNGFLCSKDGRSLIHCIGGAVTIPEEVREIPEDAFEGLPVDAVVLPGKLEEIGVRAFAGCVGLRSISIPSEVKRIGELAFSGCTNLVQMRLPPGLRVISPGAFMGCESLKDVEIPKGVVIIRECAFRNCRALERVVIPSSMRYVMWRAFADCKKGMRVEMRTQEAKVDDEAFPPSATVVKD